MATGNIFNNDYFFYWRISDVDCSPEKLIKSPKFCVQPFAGVFWRLHVEITESFDGRYISLHRVQNNRGPELLLFDYELTVEGSVTTLLSKEFKKVKFYNVDQSSPKMYAHISNDPVKRKKFLVTCKMFKCNLDQSFDSGFYYPNLSTLSENLLSGYVKQMYADVTLNVKKQYFVAHKAILYARLPTLAVKLFSRKCESDLEVEVFSIKPNLMKSLLHYAYSGCLEDDCHSNSHELYNLAKKFHLTDLQQLFQATSSSCVAKTTLNVQKMSFTWIFDYPLNWILGIEKGIAILPHTIGLAETITIGYSIFRRNKQEHLNFIFQFPKMPKGIAILMDCTVTATRQIKNEVCTILCLRIRSLFTTNETWSPIPEVTKHHFNKHLSTIKFIFEVKLCDGECKPFIEELNCEIAWSLPSSKNYEMLSFDLSNLLHQAVYCDIILKIGEGQTLLPAHRAILSARSITFNSLIQQYTAPDNVLQVDGVSEEALIFIVNYIYSGKTRNLKVSNVHDFNAAAKYFQMDALVTETNDFIEQHCRPSSDSL